MRFDPHVSEYSPGGNKKKTDLDSISDDSESIGLDDQTDTYEGMHRSTSTGNLRDSTVMRNLTHHKPGKLTTRFSSDNLQKLNADTHSDVSVHFDQLEMDRVRKAIYKSCAAASDGQLTSGCLLELFAVNGINFKDPRIKTIRHKLRHIGGLRKDIVLEPDTFCDVIQGSTMLLDKILKGRLIVPDFPDLCNDIDQIYEAIEPLDGGDLATYIPQLGNQDPSLLGIAVCTVDGQRYSVGCGDYKFCVQSCCKPISYLIAAEEHGFDVVHHHIGREPSGAECNKLHLKDDPLPDCPDRKM